MSTTIERGMHPKVIVQDGDESSPRITECPLIKPTWTLPNDEPYRLIHKDFWYGASALGALFAYAALHPWHAVDVSSLILPMGAITSAVCTSFKAELGTATHNFTTGQHSIRCALYTSTATLGASTTAYSATNEISGTGYTAGGVAIANVTPTTSGTTGIYDWADAQWTTASFTANGCLVYNDTAVGNNSIFVISFGSDQTVTSGTFTIQWPTADASNAIIRIA